jgi:hypothetical protein
MPRFQAHEHPRHHDGKFRRTSHFSGKAQRCVSDVANRLEAQGEDPKRALERAFAICRAAGMHKTKHRVFVALKTYERELEHARRARK